MGRTCSMSLVIVFCMATLCVSFTVGYSGDGEELVTGSAAGGSGSSSGSGSGSGSEEEMKDQSCVTNMTNDENEGNNLTSSTAYTAAMCSLLCMEDVTSNPKYQDTDLENVTIGGVWTFKYFPEFGSENHRRNCPAYREFAECARGCLVRAVEPDAMQFSRRQCRNECFDECKNESDVDNHYFNPYCTIDCNKGYCRQGCEHYNNIIRKSNTSGSPPSPTQHPQLIKSFIDGEVITRVEVSVPANVNGTHEHPVGIIYRVVDQMTNITKYLYEASPNEYLKLDDFACRKVSISFVMVNRFGASLESPPLNITVPGGELTVNKPEDLQVQMELDKRPGYFGYVIVTLSWNNPEGFIEGLHHYIVKIHPYNKANHPSFISSPLTNTSLTVQDTLGSRLLVYGDQVKIDVCTIVNIDEECAELKSHSIQEFKQLMDGRNPVNITDCIATWTGSDYTFTLHWTIPEFMAYGNGIFSTFHLSIEERIAKRFIDSYSIPKTANKTSYFNTWSNLPPLDSQNHYVFRVTPQWTDSDIYRKPTIDDATCIKNAVPPPSSPVLNVTMLDLDIIGDNIEFKFQWEPPTHPNGEVTVYTACLGGHKLPNFEKNPGTVVDGNDTNCVQINAKEVHSSWNHRTPRPDCLYFQIRANTELGGGGKWSKTIIIYDKVIIYDENCPQPTSATPRTTPLAATDPADPSFAPLDNSHQRKSSTLPVVVVLGTLAVVVLLSILTAVTVICTRIRRRKRRIRHVLARQSDDIDLMFTGRTKTTLISQKELLITADEWEIPPEQVIIEESIGEGAFGEVLKGTLKGPLSNPKVPRALKTSICIPVAVKMLKTSAKGNERRDFLQEIELMKKVSEGQNPHVVSMVGCVTIQEPLCLITEYVRYGNLLQYLRSNQRLYTDRVEGEDEVTYTELGNVNATDLISFAYQIATGMEYLSSLGIVHRDLACRNILVGEGKVLKITDLGMSRETEEVYVQKTKGRVPLKWMAVESIITREFTAASDVWAYGVVLWEIGTLGGFPYPSIQNEDLLPLLKRGYRMEKPDNCSSDVYAIMLECWQEDPGKRPSFFQLRARFDSMLMAEKKDTYIDLQIDVNKPYYNPDLAADAEVLDQLINNVGRFSPNPGKMISATSPFHLRGISPSQSDFTDTSGSQRSPSPVMPPEKPPGAGSNLQPPAKERKNVYVDDPSTLQNSTELTVTPRGGRSPRARSPGATGIGGGEFPRPASLQLVMENKNVYVDTPSARRSVHITSPPDWTSSGYQSVPTTGINLNGAVAAMGGASGVGEPGEQGGSSTMPEIFISLN